MNRSNVNCGFGSLSMNLVKGIKNYYLQEGDIKIGSADEADIRYGNVPGLEAVHCIIDVEKNQKAIIFNMSKSNPIKVNDEIVEKSHQLKNGDVVDMMGKIFKYNSNDGQKTPKTKIVRLIQSESKQIDPKPATRTSLRSIKKTEMRTPNFSGGTKSFLKNRGKLPTSLIPVRKPSKSLFQDSKKVASSKMSLPANMLHASRTLSKSNASKLLMKENPSTVENMEHTEVDGKASLPSTPLNQATTRSQSELSTKKNHSTFDNLENTGFEELLSQTNSPEATKSSLSSTPTDQYKTRSLSKLSMKENSSTVENMEHTEVDGKASLQSTPLNQSTTRSLSKLSTKVNHSTMCNLENTEFDELLSQTNTPNATKSSLSSTPTDQYKTRSLSKLSMKGNPSTVENMEHTEVDGKASLPSTPLNQSTTRSLSKLSTRVNHSTMGNLKNTEFDELLGQTNTPNALKVYNFETSTAKKGAKSSTKVEDSTKDESNLIDFKGTLKTPVPTKRFLSMRHSQSLQLKNLPSPIKPLRSENNSEVETNTTLFSEDEYKTATQSAVTIPQQNKSRKSTMSFKKCIPASIGDSCTIDDELPSPILPEDPISNLAQETPVYSKRSSSRATKSNYGRSISQVWDEFTNEEKSIENTQSSEKVSIVSLLDSTNEFHDDAMQSSSSNASEDPIVVSIKDSTEESIDSERSSNTPYRPILEDITPVSSDKISTNELSLKRLSETPKEVAGGSKKLKKTPKPLKEPLNDLTDVRGVKNLLKTPKIQKEPLNDLSDLRGVKKILATPKPLKEPLNDLSDVKGVKNLLKTPRAQREPLNDLTDVRGVKKIMATPKAPKEPLNDLTDVKGVKNLLKTPKAQNSPKNDLTDVKGIKKIMSTPKQVKEPLNDLSDVRGVRQLMKTPKEEEEPNYQGVADLFSKVFEKAPLKTYRGHSSPKAEKSETNVNISLYIDPRVEDWVEESAERTNVRKRRVRIIEEVTYYNEKNKKTEPARMTRRQRKLTEEENAKNDISNEPLETRTARKTARNKVINKEEPETPKSEPAVEEEPDKSSKTKSKTSKRKKTSKEIIEPAKEESPKRNKRNKTTNKRMIEEKIEEESAKIIKKRKLSNDIEAALKEPVRSSRRNKPTKNNEIIEATEEETLNINKRKKTNKKNIKMDEEELTETSKRPKKENKKNTKEDEEEPNQISERPKRVSKKTTKKGEEESTESSGRKKATEKKSSKENIEPVEETPANTKTRRKAKNSEPVKEESSVPKRVLRKRNNSVSYR